MRLFQKIVLLLIIGIILSLSIVSQAQYTVITSPEWHPDGNYIAIASSDTVEIWDGELTTIETTLNTHATEVTSLAWSPDGTKLATGDDDGVVIILDTENWSHIATYTGHTDSIASMTWSNTSDALFSVQDGNSDENLHILHINNGVSDITIRSTLGSGARIVHSPIYTQFLSVGGSIIVIQNSIEEGRLHYYRTDDFGSSNFDDYTNLMISAAWNPDSDRIVTGSLGGSVYVWDATILEPLEILIATENYNPQGIFDSENTAVRAVSYNADGSRILSAASDGTVRVWDAITYELLDTMQVQPFINASWHPTGEKLVVISTEDATPILIDTSHLTNEGEQVGR